jgi:hypothetical protein
MLMVGYFEGIDSERGIAWRCADSLLFRESLGSGLDESTPEHSSVSRTRRLISLETHQEVFAWMLGVLADEDLLEGETLGMDATRPWRPTRRFAASCAVERGSPTGSSSRILRRRRGSSPLH